MTPDDLLRGAFLALYDAGSRDRATVIHDGDDVLIAGTVGPFFSGSNGGHWGMYRPVFDRLGRLDFERADDVAQLCPECGGEPGSGARVEDGRFSHAFGVSGSVEIEGCETCCAWVERQKGAA